MVAAPARRKTIGEVYRVQVAKASLVVFANPRAASHLTSKLVVTRQKILSEATRRCSVTGRASRSYDQQAPSITTRRKLPPVAQDRVRQLAVFSVQEQNLQFTRSMRLHEQNKETVPRGQNLKYEPHRKTSYQIVETAATLFLLASHSFAEIPSGVLDILFW